ncbi:MAG: hypothetical protein RL189_1668 [Pseudomonadota bacterium]
MPPQRGVLSLPESIQHVVIDEVQKLPKLLAGRTALRHIFPLTWEELGEAFEEEAVLRLGTLPRKVPARQGSR